MKIAIVIPTYNEKGNISSLMEKVLKQRIDGLEIIVVDDNSPDGTGNIVREISEAESRVHLLSRPRKMGLGTAYVSGFQYALRAGAEYIFEMDADFSHNPDMIPVFLEKLENSDVVIGSRYLGGIRILNWPLRRLILSYLANWYARLVTGLRLSDITSGFKAYRKEVLEKVNLSEVKSEGYAFQIEMKYRAKRAGFSLTEIPIVFEDRHSGTSKISRRVIIEALFMVWKLRFSRKSRLFRNEDEDKLD